MAFCIVYGLLAAPFPLSPRFFFRLVPRGSVQWNTIFAKVGEPKSLTQKAWCPEQ